MKNQETIRLLREIRDLLEPISAQFNIEYHKEKLDLLKSLMTEQRKPVFSLLFDPRRLKQDKIALEANVSQPTVSRFITSLLENKLIKERLDSNGKTYFLDVYGLLDFLEKEND